MTDYVSNCHPRHTRIFAFSNDSAFRTAFSNDPEKTLQIAFDVLKDRAGFVSDEKVVVISDVLAGSGIDAIQIRTLL
jgi:pyruvate kinase